MDSFYLTLCVAYLFSTRLRTRSYYIHHSNYWRDLAKNAFSIHIIDAYGKCILRKTVKRNKILDTFAKLPPCLIGIETCSGAHLWARELLQDLSNKI